MPGDWRATLDGFLQERFAKLVEVRRHLHAHPEPSGEERETSLYLYQMLGDEGFTVRMGPEGRGLIVEQPDSPAAEHGDVAIRADIDALHIQDAKQVDYRSRCDGVMHACGHDAHTAIAYGAITALRHLAAAEVLDWPVPFRGVFQPAEETCEGARQMIEVGALEGVDSILAVHMDPSRRLGHIGLRTGTLTANCDEMLITIQGRGGHAARPHEASDPIAAAAQLLNALYLFVPRMTDSQDALVVTIGKIQGGEHSNVIPEHVSLGGTIRSLDRDVRRQAMDHIHRLAAGIGATTDTSIEVEFGVGCRSVENDPELMGLLRVAAREVVSDAGLEEIPRASMGSEDFAFYLEHVPGAMIRLGCSSDRIAGSPLHTPTFDIDEEALLFGAKVLARTAVLWSDPDRQRRVDDTQTLGTW